MNNYGASVMYGTLALALMGVWFYATGDSTGFMLIVTAAVFAWASCYITAAYEQVNVPALAVIGLTLTGWAVIFSLVAFVRLGLSAW